MRRIPALVALPCLLAASVAEAAISLQELDAAATAIAPRMIEWRRDFHQNPELSNREFRTSQKVAEHLKSLGLEVKTGVAHTGVLAVLRGGRPGPAIALRADMDALPVAEQVDLPFKSTATAEYRGEKVGVMHACGHDAHTAILMAAAEILSKHRKDLPGTILFVFQPAEEGAPDGERGGAPLMLDEGAFDWVKPEAAFGLHVHSSLHTGVIGYRPGPFMAASDRYSIVVTGRQTHGAQPWKGVDPIVVASQIVLGLQTIVSRQMNIAQSPVVLTVGAIKGGVRNNIVPETAEMIGTFRTFDAAMREDLIARMKRTAENIAEASGAIAKVTIAEDRNPVTTNDPALTKRILPSLERAAGSDRVKAIGLQMGAEDFAWYGQRVPSVFFWVGITPPDRNLMTTPANHSPLFYVDESGLGVALRAMLDVAVDYLQGPPRG